MSLKSILLIIALIFILAACASKQEDGLVKDTRVIMGTYVTISVVKNGMTGDEAMAAINGAFDQITKVDKLMSTYKPESQLSMINKNAGIAPVKADPEVIAVIEKAIEVAKTTDGAFDPTVGPLVRLWGVGGKDANVPDSKKVQDAMPEVGYGKVEVDRDAGTVFIKKKGMSIDLGAIAKGYAADLAVNALQESGIKGGIVAVAGDLKLFGLRHGGSLWRVGIQHPREKDGVLVTLKLTSTAISTSGDYERYFIKDGVRYCHIMDPRTGYPAKGLVSVTVLANDSWLADSMATGIFVLGPEKGYALAMAHPEIEVLMVGLDGKILATGRFKSLGIQPLQIPRD